MLGVGGRGRMWSAGAQGGAASVLCRVTHEVPASYIVATLSCVCCHVEVSRAAQGSPGGTPSTRSLASCGAFSISWASNDTVLREEACLWSQVWSQKSSKTRGFSESCEWPYAASCQSSTPNIVFSSRALARRTHCAAIAFWRDLQR